MRTEELRKKLEELPIKTTGYEYKAVSLRLSRGDIGRVLKVCQEAGMAFVVKDAELPEMPAPNGSTGEGWNSIVEQNSKEIIEEVLWRMDKAGFRQTEEIKKEVPSG
ncbi:hypothetical protein ES703_101657 [subsurface metagenome]